MRNRFGTFFADATHMHYEMIDLVPRTHTELDEAAGGY